jgi:hypothetical protein
MNFTARKKIRGAKIVGNERAGQMDNTILQTAQMELMKHSWDTFVNDPPRAGVKGSVVPGCPACRKIIYTDNQFLSHLALDVLPGILKVAGL